MLYGVVMMKIQGSNESRTRVGGIRIHSDNHYTIEPDIRWLLDCALLLFPRNLHRKFLAISLSTLFQIYWNRAGSKGLEELDRFDSFWVRFLAFCTRHNVEPAEQKNYQCFRSAVQMVKRCAKVSQYMHRRTHKMHGRLSSVVEHALSKRKAVVSIITVG